jgi:hypothetical protein
VLLDFIPRWPGPLLTSGLYDCAQPLLSSRQIVLSVKVSFKWTVRCFILSEPTPWSSILTRSVLRYLTGVQSSRLGDRIAMMALVMVDETSLEDFPDKRVLCIKGRTVPTSRLQSILLQSSHCSPSTSSKRSAASRPHRRSTYRRRTIT